MFLNTRLSVIVKLSTLRLVNAIHSCVEKQYLYLHVNETLVSFLIFYPLCTYRLIFPRIKVEDSMEIILSSRIFSADNTVNRITYYVYVIMWSIKHLSFSNANCKAHFVEVFNPQHNGLMGSLRNLVTGSYKYCWRRRETLQK